VGLGVAGCGAAGAQVAQEANPVAVSEAAAAEFNVLVA